MIKFEKSTGKKLQYYYISFLKLTFIYQNLSIKVKCIFFLFTDKHLWICTFVQQAIWLLFLSYNWFGYCSLLRTNRRGGGGTGFKTRTGCCMTTGLARDKLIKVDHRTSMTFLTCLKKADGVDLCLTLDNSDLRNHGRMLSSMPNWADHGMGHLSIIM